LGSEQANAVVLQKKFKLVVRKFVTAWLSAESCGFHPQ
jgi:hypothetical protein